MVDVHSWSRRFDQGMNFVRPGKDIIISPEGQGILSYLKGTNGPYMYILE